MSKLVWDKTGERFYETGVDRGVLYPQVNGAYPKGVAWNGLTGVTESPSGAEATAIYADNTKYLSLMSAEELGATVEAYTYPEEFAECDGSANIATGVTIGQQARKSFGLCYRTIKGNDVDGNDHGYILHLIYGAMASPSEKAYATVSDSPEAITFSWELTTTPVSVPGFKPTASLTIDSTKADKTKLAALEEILYGKDPSTPDGLDGVDPRMPLPEEIMKIMAPDALTADNLTVQAESGETTLFGKTVNTLQSDVVVGDGTITGTLLHVTDYTQFSNTTGEQTGNYLALNVTSNVDGASINVEITGGSGTTVKNNGSSYVIRVTDEASQTVKVTATKGEATVSKTYTLTGITANDA